MYNIVLPKPLDRASSEEIDKGLFFGFVEDSDGFYEVYNIFWKAGGGLSGILFGKCERAIDMWKLYNKYAQRKLLFKEMKRMLN
jgi:hypothetical protein